MWSNPATRAVWLQYGPVAMIAPAALLVGAFFGGNAQGVIW